ncbi:hypothetical protein BBJ28_00010739 [Nothophytophthora sp. Chile5]|nr:hypothetical protein BBJ28_00010739 [Nothophytophthora sp. Chile5]
MAPKKNKQREKQEQSRASSSARAHQSLLASSAAPSAFIGFASFAQPAPNAVQAIAPAFYAKPLVQTVYDGQDHEIALALKMLAKKGTVTKSKALLSLLQDVLPPRKPTEIRPMLGHFVQLYTFEMRDQNDRKVRQSLNEVLGAIAAKLKPKAFAPHLQRLLPYWYVAMHDLNSEVAAAAQKAFETLFPESDLRVSVVEEHLSTVMEEFQLFFTKTPDTFDGIPLQPDEREERYERCISAAVLSINAIVKLFAKHQLSDKLRDEESSCSVATVVSSDKFTRLATASSKHPNFSRDSVRRAAYVTLTTLCTDAKAIVAAREEAFGKVVLGVLGDKSPANHEDMWNAVLTFLQTFPSVWHSSPSFPRYVVSAIYPRLFAQIRHGFFGSGRSSFPTLLPLLSMAPLDVAVDPVKGVSALYAGVLEQCWKFVESKDARFGEAPAITAFFECLTGFFSIFLNSQSSVAWLSEQDTEPLTNNYVNQFEKVLSASLVTTLGSPGFPDDKVALYASSLLKMSSRLRSFSATSAVASTLKEDFADKLHVWIRQALSGMTATLSFVPSRVNILICSGVRDAKDSNGGTEREQWLLTDQKLYRECLVQVDAVVADSTFSAGRNASLVQLLEVINCICGALPLSTLLTTEDEESAETHFDRHYRTVLRVIGGWNKTTDDKSATKTMRAALELTRPFFLAAREKKQFLLQLFQDCGVQFGDMVEATDIIQYGLQFPITPEGCKHWLSCGSWQDREDGGASAAKEADPTLEALQAIWQGKLLDEFLMISLKGRLDDLDADAFATLLSACLGGLSNFPVVSPDAVVILCHFVIQNGSDCSDAVVMRILTHICELFLKLDGQLPSELEAVEVQLYKLLFHLSSRGNYRSEASALWERTVRHSLKQWTATRTETFVNDLAEHVNSLLLADLPVGTVSFNTKQFAAYAKSFLLLSTDETTFSVSQVVEKLDAVHLRCLDDGETSRQKLFFSRVLACLGDMCEDEQVVGILQTYFVDLAERDEQAAVDLVGKLVDLDVAHAMTWVVFHSHADDHVQGDTRLLDIVESYLTLERLYEALKSSSSVMDKVLADVLAVSQVGSERVLPEYRDWILSSKSQGEASAAVANEGSNMLTRQQHEELDALVVATLCIYSSIAARAALVQQVVAHSSEWKTVAIQSVAVSLLSAMNADDETHDEVATALQGFFGLCEREAITSSADGFFEYIRLAIRAFGEEERLAVTPSSSIKHDLVSISVQETVLSRLQETLAPGSSTVVEIAEWIAATEYVSAFPASLLDATPTLHATWEKVARLLITHAIAGKTETAKVAALKIHKRSTALSEREVTKGEEEQAVLAYPDDLVNARLALLGLLSALHEANADALQELAAHYREALLAAVLCGFSEGAELKAHVVTTYVALEAPSECLRLIHLWFGVEKVLANVLPALRATLMSIHDVDHVNRLVLESFGGVETLASLFNDLRYPLPPVLRVLLYILVSYSGALRLRSYDENAIDVNAEDEAATEAALAKALIPKALRSALRAVFTGKEASAGSIRMRSRKQKAHEREDIVGKLLLWDLFLQLFPTAGSGSGSGSGSDGVSPTMIASALSSYAARHGLLTNFLTFGAALLSQDPQLAGKGSDTELQDTSLFDVTDLEKEQDDDVWSFHKARVFQLGTLVFFRTVVRLPAMVRAWWNDECSRGTRSWAAKYFEDHITPSVLAAELALIQQASGASLPSTEPAWDAEEMTVKGSRVSREITTTYMKDECALEMVVRVPSSYPLRCVEVECTKRIGIAEDRWRRWVLQIIRVTSSRDGSLLDAVLLWKRNVDQEFEGVEPCPICYSILNPKTMGLPSLPCKTCNNKYHNSCLYKWFNQSGKNKCPICQQPFC